MSHKKSISEHRRAGTYRKDRHANRVDPTGDLVELPPSPIDLNDAALKIYESEGRRLIEMGILRAENLRLLALYASEVEVYCSQMEEAQLDGVVVILPNAISTTSAHRKAAESALKNATALADKLGLSPIGRVRMGLKISPEKTPADPLAQFLNN